MKMRVFAEDMPASDSMRRKNSTVAAAVPLAISL